MRPDDPKRRAVLSWLAALALLPAPAEAAEARLVLFGGGDRPAAGLARFVEWAGGEQARVLVIPWASAEPQESCEGVREDLKGHSLASVECAPLLPLTEDARTELVGQLDRAGGVFFGGGDQNRVMDALDGTPLLGALQTRYRAGVVFGGTSAGSAAMSGIMITGEGDFTVLDGDSVGTRPGLGMLTGVIVDQHFIRRQRQNRLFGLVLKRPAELGLGVDEGAAVAVRGGRHAEALAGQAMVVDGRAKPGALLIRVLRPGDRFDLVRRKPE